MFLELGILDVTFRGFVFYCFFVLNCSSKFYDREFFFGVLLGTLRLFGFRSEFF